MCVIGLAKFLAHNKSMDNGYILATSPIIIDNRSNLSHTPIFGMLLLAISELMTATPPRKIN
jgi:hypothetical protein